MHNGSVGNSSWTGKSHALSKDPGLGCLATLEDVDHPRVQLRVTAVACLRRESMWQRLPCLGAVSPFFADASRAMPPVAVAMCFLLDKESMHRSSVGIERV
jgi:hypothetical protein